MGSAYASNIEDVENIFQFWVHVEGGRDITHPILIPWLLSVLLNKLYIFNE